MAMQVGTLDNTVDAVESLHNAHISVDTYLFLVLETARPMAGGARYLVTDCDEVLIGRGPRRGIERVVVDGRRRLIVRVPDPLISSSHARLSRRGADWLFEDLGSTNGSRVGQVRVTSVPLAHEAVLELGGTFFTFRARFPTQGPVLLELELGGDVRRIAGLDTLLPTYAHSLSLLVQLATANVPVLLLGETGTGKEVLARAVHTLSQRRGAFVPVNCGALPTSLVESQFFGHVKGAFSGAVRDEPGLVRAADGGTLFLDEIGDLQKGSQAALLRVLQDHQVCPVGSTRSVAVDLRVVAATHKNIDFRHQGAEFRADLFARLSGFTFTLLPLRHRKEDLGLLLGAILGGQAPSSESNSAPLRLSPSFFRALLAYDWPLNVRELQQTLSVCRLLATHGELAASILPPAIRAALPSEFRDDGLRESHVTSPNASSPSARPPQALGPKSPHPQGPVDEKEERVLAALLHSMRGHQGNITHVARDLGKTRTQIHRWLKRFGLTPEQFRGESGQVTKNG